jgi:hypothetical protein
MGLDILRGLLALRAEVGEFAVGGGAMRPLVRNATRVVQESLHRLPDISIELVDADLTVVADATASESMSVTANASIVRVAVLLALRRCSRHELAVEGVTALRAHREALKKEAPTAHVPLSSVLVALQLFRCRLE